MKRTSMFMLLALASCAAQPAFANGFATTVISSECELVAKDGSATGAVVGTGAGAAVGGYIGDSLFGRGGGAIGALIGGIAGGAAGENVAAKRVYSCLLTVRNPEGKAIYVETTGRLRNVGETVRVFVNPDGTYLAR